MERYTKHVRGGRQVYFHVGLFLILLLDGSEWLASPSGCSYP
jgi:hypothetical protein